MNIEISKLEGEFAIEPQGERELVLVTLTATIESEDSRVVAAGVDVDGLEVLPSVRIELCKGATTSTLPPLKIFRQLGEEGHVSRDYKLTVAIGNGQELHAVKDLPMTF